jgi:hypothetical protein
MIPPAGMYGYSQLHPESLKSCVPLMLVPQGHKFRLSRQAAQLSFSCAGGKELPNYTFLPNCAMLPTSNCEVVAGEGKGRMASAENRRKI